MIICVNKTDGPHQDGNWQEFHALGFDEVLPVSAEHRRGIVDLAMSIAERLPARTDDPVENREDDGALRLALVGRPNVGKSSLINRLLGDPRQIVADEPGTTRDSTDVRLQIGDAEVVLIDTAGLRRAGKRAERLERGSAYMSVRAIERADLVLLLLDASEGVTDQDAKLARLALDRGRPLVLVLNKWDTIDSPDRRKEVHRQLERKLGFVREPEILEVSALTGKGANKLIPRSLKLASEMQREIPTSAVNRVLQEAIERNVPPAAGRRRASFYYATQVSQRPLTIAVFMNDPKLVPANYRRYLEGVFRKHFAVRSAPVRLVLRGRREGSGEPDEVIQ